MNESAAVTTTNFVIIVFNYLIAKMHQQLIATLAG